MDVPEPENISDKFLVFDFSALLDHGAFFFFFLNLLKDVYSKKVSGCFQCKGTVEKT